MDENSIDDICIRLREIERGDLVQLNQWRHDKEVVDGLGCNYLFIAEEIDEQWYEHYLCHRDINIRLSIIVEDTESYIGNVNLTGIQSVNRSAELSILIGDKDYWKKGIGEQATRMMLTHGFHDLNLHRIYLTVVEHNTAAIKVYEKVGFKHEGRERESVFRNGQFYSMLKMAILDREFAA